jgi:hypothetical protein
VPVLPALDFHCERCGVDIHHDSDTQVVRRVAVHHNSVMHRVDEHFQGSLVIRWLAGFAPPDLVDRLLSALCERFGPRGVDLWVDGIEAAFSYLRPEWLEECTELVASFVGPDLEVVDRR